jgi:hypothetical protein
MQKIQDIKKGDFFKRKKLAKKIYEKGSYCRTNKAYECTSVDDINDFLYIKKDKKVFKTDY